MILLVLSGMLRCYTIRSERDRKLEIERWLGGMKAVLVDPFLVRGTHAFTLVGESRMATVRNLLHSSRAPVFGQRPPPKKDLNELKLGRASGYLAWQGRLLYTE